MDLVVMKTVKDLSRLSLHSFSKVLTFIHYDKTPLENIVS